MRYQHKKLLSEYGHLLVQEMDVTRHKHFVFLETRVPHHLLLVTLQWFGTKFFKQNNERPVHVYINSFKFFFKNIIKFNPWTVDKLTLECF